MKVLQIINSLYTGGAEKLIVDSVPLYQEKGIEMDVLCLKDEKTDFWQQLEKKTKGKIIGLSQGSVYNPLLVFKIIPYLKNYDLIHAHIFPTLYWVVLAKWLSFSKIKIVYTEHNTNNRRQESNFLKWIDSFLYKGVSIIGCITNQVKINLQKHLKDDNPQKFQLIENGVLLSDFITAKALNKNLFFTQEDFFLIQVSSFREQKDQPTLIKALPYLEPHFKLLLVGDGPLRRNAEKLVHDSGLVSRVKFLGNRTDIPQLLKMADMIILSSYYEGLSLSSIEGMSVKPFIASNVPGLKDIVGGYGLLFERGNARQLASLIQQLASDEVFYQEVAKKCRERARDFDIHKMVGEYIELYRRLI